MLTPQNVGEPLPYHHTLIIDSDYLVAWELQDDAGNLQPIPVGTTASIEIRDKPTDGSPSSQLLATAAATITDHAAGEFEWGDSRANTAGLTPQQAQYVVRFIFPTLEDMVVIRGDIEIEYGVSP